MEKRVLMVATVPAMIGQFNMDNINILLNMGYKVDVAADFTDISVWPTERVLRFKDSVKKKGVDCIQMDFSRNPLRIDRHIKSYKAIVELLRKKRYSFIHTHTPIASALMRLAARQTKTKVIYTAHGFHFFKGAPLKNWIIYYPIEKYLSRYTDVLITINKEDYERAKKRFRAKRTEYIPGVGVDTEKYALSKVDRQLKRISLVVENDDFLLLSVGELSSRKNQRIVIEALHIIQEKGCIGNIVYLIAGTGQLKEEYELLIKKYGLEKHIKLLGFRTDVEELCNTVDCFVHPSIREGLGIAPLEAMAAGLPLISASINGMKDYTEDCVSGCCVVPTDVMDMVCAIEKMYREKDFREQCGKNNKATSKNFDKKNSNEVMQRIYNSI